MHIYNLPILALLILLFAGATDAAAMSYANGGHDHMAAPTVPEVVRASPPPATKRSNRESGMEMAPTRPGNASPTLNATRPVYLPDGDSDQDSAEQRVQRWQSRVPGALK